MQNMGLLMEYEDILLKKRKDFSANGNGICRCGYCPHLKAGSHGFYPFDGNTFV